MLFSRFGRFLGYGFLVFLVVGGAYSCGYRAGDKHVKFVSYQIEDAVGGGKKVVYHEW